MKMTLNELKFRLRTLNIKSEDERTIAHYAQKARATRLQLRKYLNAKSGIIDNEVFKGFLNQMTQADRELWLLVGNVLPGKPMQAKREQVELFLSQYLFM